MEPKELPKDVLLCQLAEECAECAHAALKYARVLRGENPTPTSEADAAAALREEYADVRLCANVAGVTSDAALRDAKYARWCERLEEVGK